MMLLPSMAVEEDSTDQQVNSVSLFRGLDADEMFIGGFIGPRAAYYRNGQLIYEGLKDDTAFRLIKEAGFNYICDNDFSYSGDMLADAEKALQYAEDIGLMYLMPAYDVMEIDGEVMAGDGEIAAKLQEMYKYKSFGGFFLRDEPTSDMFPFIKKCLDKLYEIQGELGYNDLNVYLNLLLYLPPEWLSNGTDSTMTWPKYIRSLSATGVNYLSFDMYPIQGEAPAVSTTWFKYLGMMNEAALEVGKPWMGYAQVGGSTPSYSYDTRVTSEGELRWDVHTMLAFGAKGIQYYILMSPPYFANAGISELNNHSIINVYGEKTAYWFMAKEINTQIQSMDHILMNCAHKGVIINGKTPCQYDGEDLLDTYRGLKSVTGNALIGCFDYQGETALLVVNNDFTADGEILLSLDKEYDSQVIQDCMEYEETTSELKLQLSAGDCALVVLKGNHVSFDLNYKTSTAAPASMEVKNNTYGILPVPESRPGYRFAGWYGDPSANGDPILPTDMIETVSHTLYAKWLYIQGAVLLRTDNTYGSIEKVSVRDQVHWEYKSSLEQSPADPYLRKIEVYWQGNAAFLQAKIQIKCVKDGEGDALPCVHAVMGRNEVFALTDTEYTFFDDEGNLVQQLQPGQYYTLHASIENLSCLVLVLADTNQPCDIEALIENPMIIENTKEENEQSIIDNKLFCWWLVPAGICAMFGIVLIIKKCKK